MPTLVLRPERTDLGILVGAARNLLSGAPVYDLTQPNEHTKPPLATLLAVPLTFIDLWWLERLWDVMNVLLYVWLARRFAGNTTAAIVGILVTLNNWNQEIRLGQYNVLSLALIVAGSGPLAALALLLKPTNVFFVPWLIAQARDPWKFLAGAAATCVGIAAIYAGLFGVDGLVQAHVDYLRILPLSSEKHLYRTDNHTLLRFLPSLPALLAGAAAVLLTCRDRRIGFLVACFATLVLSPMAWFQNYVLLLPFAIWLWEEKRFVALFFLYFGLQVFNPTFIHGGYWGRLKDWPIPLLATLLSVAATLCGADHIVRKIRAQFRQV